MIYIPAAETKDGVARVILPVQGWKELENFYGAGLVGPSL